MQAKRGQPPRVQRPMILDVLPADLAPRLDVKPLTISQKIVRVVPKKMRHWWTPVIGSVVIAGIIVAIVQPWKVQPVKLPSALTAEISGFTPYYFSELPTGFTVNTKTMSFSDGVLFFQVKNQSGSSVVVSEQTLPNDFAHSTPQGDEVVAGVQGTGVISTRDNRTIGTLVTNKDPKALISLNAASSVDASTFKQIMQTLRPVN